MTEVQIFASSFADQVEANAHDADDADKEELRILLERVTARLVCVAASVTASRIWICDAWRCASILAEVNGCTIGVSTRVVCATGVPSSVPGSTCAASVAGFASATSVAIATSAAVPSSGSIVLW